MVPNTATKLGKNQGFSRDRQLELTIPKSKLKRSLGSQAPSYQELLFSGSSGLFPNLKICCACNGLSAYVNVRVNYRLLANIWKQQLTSLSYQALCNQSTQKLIYREHSFAEHQTRFPPALKQQGNHQTFPHVCRKQALYRPGSSV